MPLIMSVTGNAILPRQSGNLSLKVCAVPGVNTMENSFGSSPYIEQASKLSGSGVRSSSGRISRYAAIRDKSIHDGGSFWSGSYEVAEGSILCLFGSYNRGYGKARISGNMLLRVRSEAAHRKIVCKLVDSTFAMDVGSIEGRFDILTVKEAKAYGVVVPKIVRHTFDHTSTAFCIYSRIIPISPEIAPKAVPVVTEITVGETTVAVRRIARPKRDIR